MFDKKYSSKAQNAEVELAKHFSFVVDDDIFVGVNDNAYVLTSIPPQSFKGLNHYSDRMLRWGGNDYIYAGYLPVTPRYEGRLLNRLASIKILQIGGMYSLDPNVAQSWHLLEKNLLQMYNILIATCRTPISFSLDYIMPAPPSDCGYLRKHQLYKAALSAAHSSRHAFDLLMAALSFAIMLHNPERDDPNENPFWAKALGQHKVHAEYIQLVKESQIADFRPENKRIGTIVSWKCRWLKYLERMEVANVPFWIHFGDFRTNRDPYVNCNGGHHARRYPYTMATPRFSLKLNWKLNGNARF